MTRRILSEKTLEFVIPGRPLQGGAPRNRVKLKEEGVHDKLGAEGYINLIKMIAKAAMAMQKWEILKTKPVYILITVYLYRHDTNYTRPETQMAIKKGTYLPMQKPDINRIMVLVVKALKGLVWANNKQLVGFLVTKKYSKEEGVEVLVGSPNTWRELNHDLRNA